MPPLLSIVGEKTEACCASVSLNISNADYSVSPFQFVGRAAVVTLGCAKNQVDSEVMIGVLRNSGYEIVTDLSVADVAIVNTCGFLQSAVKESIDSVLEVAEYKTKGRLRTLIVAGCAVERYRNELKESLPEVDSFITLEDILRVGDAARGEASQEIASLLNRAGRPYFIYDETMPRQLSTATHTAYVKISEGCNRPCTFCIIPKIRGAMRSRSIESVVREASALGAQGVREINLIAQDLTSYGKDLEGANLAKLLHALDESRAVPWIRLLYAYPIGVTDELLDAVKNLPSVVEYIDIPLQHASEKVLKEMQRPLGKFSPRRIAEYIKGRHSDIKIRTTFITGFPGETEADVRELENFISEGHFSSVGVFTYSAEQGTPAHDMDGQVPEREKKSRRERLMRAQQRVVEDHLASYVGKTLEVLVEGTHDDTDLLLSSRARFQAPEVDGTVIINDIKGASDLSAVQAGQLAHVEITEAAGYDLVGTLIRES
jgi:ribosomal protein S12 methylthiotransferase